MNNPACRKCARRGWVMPSPDSLCREAWIDGKTLWCSACGFAWDGTEQEVVAALAFELECMIPPSAPSSKSKKGK